MYLRVRKWNRVEAKVLSKEVIKHEKYSTSRAPFGVKVEYEYASGSTIQKGNKVYLVELIGGQVDHMKRDAENRLTVIKENMLIYVDPLDPSHSVMYCTGMAIYAFIFCAGIIAFLIGLSMLFE